MTRMSGPKIKKSHSSRPFEEARGRGSFSNLGMSSGRYRKWGVGSIRRVHLGRWRARRGRSSGCGGCYVRHSVAVSTARSACCADNHAAVHKSVHSRASAPRRSPARLILGRDRDRSACQIAPAVTAECLESRAARVQSISFRHLQTPRSACRAFVGCRDDAPGHRLACGWAERASGDWRHANIRRFACIRDSRPRARGLDQGLAQRGCARARR
jgi:hypothetical protein